MSLLSATNHKNLSILYYTASKLVRARIHSRFEHSMSKSFQAFVLGGTDATATTTTAFCAHLCTARSYRTRCDLVKIVSAICAILQDFIIIPTIDYRCNSNNKAAK